ncbi:MAG: hypothetical protein A2W26_12295 [Acidobacteria bacterium RBG_16_64_8]|nr:MAG: hypothetical protein A2W26_12295 [Acidobacteria bacterium RBG_16_64_8]
MVSLHRTVHEARQAARWLVRASLLLAGFSLSQVRAAGEPLVPAPESCAPYQVSGSWKSTVLRAGVTRTPEEIARCREEEMATACGFRERTLPKKLTEPVRLRSEPVDLSDDGCENAAKRWNFFTEGNSEKGCFVNAYVIPDSLMGSKTITDLATGLMWRIHSSRELTFERAKQYIDELNKDKVAGSGFSDWRLPTVEEFLSIMEAPLFHLESHLDSLLFLPELDYWTSDYRLPKGYRWTVHAGSADCYFDEPTSKNRVRAVRTISKGGAELQKDGSRQGK